MNSELEPKRANDGATVVVDGGIRLVTPSVRDVAQALGFQTAPKDKRYDVVVAGAGPAGMAAGVYGASEGLKVLIVERSAAGGQAGTSSRIENYLGFPTGLSGQELAGRAIAQSEKFGAQIMVAHSALRLECNQRPYKVTLDDGSVMQTRTIVLAIGAEYNKPSIPGLEQFIGKGIYYNATFMEAQLCVGEEVVVIGGGNSAGQAAVFLSQNTRGVHMLVRSKSLTDTMSRYLIQRIEENPSIHLHYSNELTCLQGDGHLEKVSWIDRNSGQIATRPIRHVFVMTGASPKTDWLSGCVSLDNKGFVLTGRDLENSEPPIPWPLSRRPLMLETSLPGVFVVGDARSGNVKRVASAVGEGSIVVHMVHQTLTAS